MKVKGPDRFRPEPLAFVKLKVFTVLDPFTLKLPFRWRFVPVACSKARVFSVVCPVMFRWVPVP